MGKHLQPLSPHEAGNEVDKLFNNPVGLSRFLALMDGVRRVDSFERKNNLPETDLDGQKLIRYVDNAAPIIEAAIHTDPDFVKKSLFD